VRDTRTVEEATAKTTGFAAARKDPVINGFGASAHSLGAAPREPPPLEAGDDPQGAPAWELPSAPQPVSRSRASAMAYLSLQYGPYATTDGYPAVL